MMNKHDSSPKHAKPSIRTVAFYFAAILALVSGALPANAHTLADPQQQQPCRKIGDYSVCGRFLDEWSKQGSDQTSTYVNGLPITALRPEISLVDGKTYDTQWFERAKYEAHPENKAPYDVQLGLLGASLVEGRGVIDPYTKKVRNPSDAAFVGIDKPADADGVNKAWFPETRHSVSGKILGYWNRYGGLSQFGFPLSEPFQEISEADNKPYTVQYFERNRLELHPENRAPYEVELGLLGVQQYKMTPVAGKDLPIAPPVGVKSSKDTLVLAALGQPNDLYLDAEAYLGQVSFPLWYDLLGTTPDGEAFPELAWYVPTIENGGARFVGFGDDRHLQVKYKIRPGMKWSDGVEITSNDVIFAYKLYTNPDSELCCQTIRDKIYNIDNPDRHTAIFNFLSYPQVRDRYEQDKVHFASLKVFSDQKKPAVDLDYTVAGTVLPEHALSKAVPGHIVDKGYWSDPNLMVTSGPYKLERWDTGQQIVLVPNPYYTLTAPPLLNKIIFRNIPDFDGIVAQLKSGDADAAVGPALQGRTPAQITQLKEDGLIVNSAPALAWEHLDFNLNRPYFQEKAVRQAIAYAIDRQQVVDDVSSGTWKVMNSMILPQSWGSEENSRFPSQWKEKYPLHLYPYDPARANKLLDQAGWRRGLDGVRAKGGVRLSFKYSTTQDPVRGKAQTIVAQNLQAVGIDAQAVQLRFPDFFDAVPHGDFDLAEYAWIDTLQPVGDRYTTAQIPSEQNGFGGANYNYPGYSNPHYDELSDRQQVEIARGAQYPLLAEMQSIITEDLPVIPLYDRGQIEVHSAKLMNWETGAAGNPLYKAQAMYFK